MFLSSIVVLIRNDNFWVVPLLHSVSHISVCFTDPQYIGHWFVTSGVWHFPPLAIVSIERHAIDPLIPIVAFEGRYEARSSLNMTAINLNFFNRYLDGINNTVSWSLLVIGISRICNTDRCIGTCRLLNNDIFFGNCWHLDNVPVTIIKPCYTETE